MIFRYYMVGMSLNILAIPRQKSPSLVWMLNTFMNIMNVCSDHSGSLHWRCKFSCLIPFCMCLRLLLSTWLCISQSNCRISLIRNGDRIPSHEQVVIQEYIDRVSCGSICHQSNLSFVRFFCLLRYLHLFTFSALPSWGIQVWS